MLTYPILQFDDSQVMYSEKEVGFENVCMGVFQMGVWGISNSQSRVDGFEGLDGRVLGLLGKLCLFLRPFLSDGAFMEKIWGLSHGKCRDES